MKNLLLFLLLGMSLISLSQEFAPIGTKWFYSQGTINPDLKTYLTLESIKDTSINGIECKVILKSERYIDVYKTSNHYMFSRNDSVFFYEEGDFHLLYDFGAEAGDTILLDYYKINPDESLVMVVDSVETVNINGNQRKLQHITCGNGIFIEFPGPIIEGIGSVYYMFPVIEMHMVGPLRCFQSSNSVIYKNPFSGGWDKTCDYTTGIEELKVNNEFEVYPNPTESSFSLTNIDYMTPYTLNDLNGKEIKNGELNPNQPVDISEIENGFYVLFFTTQNRQEIKRIIKK